MGNKGAQKLISNFPPPPTQPATRQLSQGVKKPISVSLSVPGSLDLPLPLFPGSTKPLLCKGHCSTQLWSLQTDHPSQPLCATSFFRPGSGNCQSVTCQLFTRPLGRSKNIVFCGSSFFNLTTPKTRVCESKFNTRRTMGVNSS